MDIRNNKYHFTYDELITFLNEAIAPIERFCKYDVEYQLATDTDNGATWLNVNHPVGSIMYSPMCVMLGAKSLLENMSDDGKVTDADMTWMLLQAFHESAHVWQYSVGYMQQEVSDDIRAMARDRVIGLYFDDYRHFGYALDTSELHADIHAISQIVKYFDIKAKNDPRFSEVDLGSIILNREQKRRGRAFTELMSCNTVDDVISSYNARFRTIRYNKKFDVASLSRKRDISENLKRLFRDKIVYELCAVDNGLDESNLLCKYIGTVQPSCFRSVLCIKDDYVKLTPKSAVEKVVGTILHVKPKPWHDMFGVDDVDNEKPDDGPDF